MFCKHVIVSIFIKCLQSRDRIFCRPDLARGS